MKSWHEVNMKSWHEGRSVVVFLLVLEPQALARHLESTVSPASILAATF